MERTHGGFHGGRGRVNEHQMSLFLSPTPPPPPTLTSTSRTTTSTITGGIMAAPVSYSTPLLLSAHVLYRCAHTHAHRQTQGREGDRQSWRGVGPTLGGWEGGTAPRRVVSTCVSFITRVETVFLVFFFFYFCARPLFTTGEARSRLL